jgi:NADH:ubiquinone oxidoreductase subunit K
MIFKNFVFILFSLVLFFFSILGIFITRKNLIIILISIELLFLSINFNFLVFSVFLDDNIGQIFSLFILTVTASEAAIGLAILILFYRIRGIISVNFINSLKG